MCQAESLAIVPGTIPIASIVADSAEATGLKWAAPAGGSTFVGANVRLDGSVSIANDTQVIIGWNAENIDSNGFHDNSTNNSRLTVPSGKGGKYLVTCQIEYAGNSTGVRSAQIRINNDLKMLTESSGQGSTAQTILISGTFNLNASDYVEIWTVQTSGGSLNLNGGSLWNSNFTISYLGA